MKKTLLLLSVLFLQICSIYAQETDTIPEDNEENISEFRSRRNVHIAPKQYNNNFIKMNVTSLLLGNLSFQYERVLVPRLSAALGLRVMPTQNLPLQNTVIYILDNYAGISVEDSDNKFVYNNLKINGLAITPEVRFYFNKHNKGLYLGLFGRYEQYNVAYNNLEFKIDNVTHTAQVDADYNSVGIGLQLGAHFKLSKRFYLDWWILGPYATYTKIDAFVSGYTINDSQFDELEEQLEDISFDNPFIKKNINIGKNSSSINMKGTLAGLRAMGLALSFRF
jgi:hypothetical protein